MTYYMHTIHIGSVARGPSPAGGAGPEDRGVQGRAQGHRYVRSSHIYMYISLIGIAYDIFANMHVHL